jgi:hypothetical protein
MKKTKLLIHKRGNFLLAIKKTDTSLLVTQKIKLLFSPSVLFYILFLSLILVL